jgi:DNA polymerase-3 subunit epsilon
MLHRPLGRAPAAPHSRRVVVRDRSPANLTFAAIDFETANRFRDSACAIGLVRVERGRVVRREYSLIRPWTRWFEFTHIHGLTWEDVAAAPRFAAVFPLIAEMCAGVELVAAHNASFDKGVLDACSERAGVPALEVRFECTVRLARSAFGIYPTRLPDVATWLGLALDHHNAASDAEACAQIVLHARRAERQQGLRRAMNATKSGEQP